MVAFALLAAIGGCSSSASLRDGTARSTMLLGADISALERNQQAGGVFRADSQPGDAIAILRTNE